MRKPIMTQHLTLTQYFKSVAAVAPSNRPRGEAPFVTISREAGAGGHALAEALAARLAKQDGELFSGWQIFDRSLCERVAADPELHVSLESLLNEEFHTGLDDYLRSVLADHSSQSKIDHRMFRTVRSICSLGRAIVIGRASALVTRDLPLGVHVRLVSQRRARIQRIRRENGVDAVAARRILDQQDARRARKVEIYFKKNIADPLLYDCVWNADTVSCGAMAESLVYLIRQRVSQRLRPTTGPLKRT